MNPNLYQTKFKNMLLFLFIILSLFKLTFLQESSCTEQWTEINTILENWFQKGDIEITESSDGKPIFAFSPKNISISSEFVGLTWLKTNLASNRGITVTFKPELFSYENEANSYPDGFALVFTSSEPEKFSGSKNAGLGYEGIIKGIAFEFDFIQNEEKGDSDKPHFSVNHNLNGVLTSSSKDRTDTNLYNIELPNFYDEQNTNFDSNLYFEIRIFNKKLTVTAKSTTDNVLLDVDFPQFQQLIENGDCRIGLTSSGSGNHGVYIKNLKVEEISINKKGKLEIDGATNVDNSVPNINAGEKITLNFYILSLCGVQLPIYLDEINANDFKLRINDDNISPESIDFDEDLTKIKIVFTLNEAKIYTAIIEFKGYDSNPLQFIVKANDVSRLELCEHGSTDEDKYYSTSILEQSKDYFHIPLCVYDNFGNLKDPSTDNIKQFIVKYPLNILPDYETELKLDTSNKRLLLKILFSNFGTYEIFCENFIKEKIRYVTVMPQYISPDKSQVSILYEQNIIQSTTNKINLRIKLKDNYNRDIPKVILTQLNCAYSDSYVILSTDTTEINKLSIESEYKEDYVVLSVNKPNAKGNYIFVPKVKCDNIDSIQLNCPIDSVTKNNNCEFFYPSDAIDTSHIKIFDEVSEGYITLEKDKEANDYLYISLDEKDNKKITEIILLDEQESNYLSNSPQTITAKLDLDDLIVTQIGNKYALILPSTKTRYNYTPVKRYELTIILNGESTFTIKVKFYFLDKYMTNVDISQTDTSKISYIAFYKQNSFTLEAQETLLLFEIYQLSDGKYLGNINNILDTTKVKLEINSEQITNCEIINHNNFFISVIGHDFKKVGKYTISLKYNDNEIFKKDIIIIPKSEPYYLANEEGTLLENESNIEIGREKLVKLVMLDKYENIINNNDIFSAFAKIKISNNDLFYIKQNYDGKIHIFNEGFIKDNSITMTLINGNTYTITSIYEPNFEDNLDILNSYGILTNEAPIIETNTDITLSLYLRDKYGNLISGTVDKSIINIYIEGENLIEVVSMTSSQSSATNGKIDYKATLGKIGDYLIKIFINNLPVECRGCHFRKNYISDEAPSKTSLYVLGNKQKIRIFNSNGLTNKKVGMVNKKNFFSFYLDQRDTYLNEIKRENSDDTIQLDFASENSDVDTSSITFCEKEKNYYELCDNVFSSWSQLSDGIYLITNTNLNYKFYIYLTDSETDSTNVTPVAANSFIYNLETTIYGKMDVPATVVLDIRNSDYKRIQGLDKSKITLYYKNLKNISPIVTEGAEEGVFNIILIAQVPGSYTFNLRYNSANVISNTITYKCSCGSDIILNSEASDFLSNGNYVFFKLSNSKGNTCSLPINWNPMNEKNFANYILKAEKDGKDFKTESYYNHVTNTLILYLDNYATEYADFYSNIFGFNFDEDYVTPDLIENIIDENHYYASISDDGTKITINALNANYEPAFNCITEDGSEGYFSISLIRIINDDFIILKTDYDISVDFCEYNADLDNTLIDAKGKYLYVVYFQGKEIYCKNCMINNEQNTIDISKTKVYHKEGDYQYYQTDENTILPLFKTNLPFFKINLMSENDNLIILETGLTIELKTVSDGSDSVSFNIGVKYSSNGNIYVYLKPEDRNKFWDLNTMEKLQLSITYDSSTYTVTYYVMDHYVKRLRSSDNCDTTIAPLIINQQTLYIKRYDEDLELEIRLSDCLKDILEVYEILKIYDSEGSASFDAELIPTDMPGSYYLFLPKNLEVNNSKKYYFMNKYNIKSAEFELSIMPGYDIAKIEFKKDENLVEDGSDKKYNYFLIEMKDKYDNIISNVGRNLFANDIYAFNIGDIPYKLSYDESLKAFRCQVPIFYSEEEIQVTSLISDYSFKIDIEVPKVYRKTLVTLDSEENNLFTFTFELKDDVYNSIDSAEYTSDVSFKYFTMNTITEQVFLKEVTSTYLGNNKFSIQLDSSFPKYEFYGFIPYIQFFPQICPSCMIKNLYPDNIYLIRDFSEHKYEPHNINKNLYLIQNYDIPTFLYWSSGDVTIESEDVTINTILSLDNVKLYSMTYNGESESININFNKEEESENNEITFKAEFIDYSLTSTSTTPKPAYVEIYGNGVYSPNFGDRKYISFFIETRDDSGKLISTKPDLIIDDTFSNSIDSIQIMNTCYTGVYYIHINLAKSGNIEFYLKFSETQTKTSNDEIIYIHSIPSFPTYISLDNKEVVNRNNIKFILYTHNAQNEAICDERLNIYMEDMNLKGSHLTLDYYDNQCELYVIFGGYATIKSNINNYVTEVNNNDKSLINISPQFSSVSIIPNIFYSEEETLNIKFIEKSSSKNIYSSNEINGDKSLNIYKYITPNKFQFVNSLSSLISNEYTFNPKNLGIEDRDIYVLIGTVVNNTMSPIMAFYHSELPTISDIRGIEAIYFNDEQKYNVLTNFMLEKTYTGDAFELTVPILLRIKFLDEKGNDIDITPDEGKKYTAKLILANDNEEKLSIDLILRHFNDKYFYIQNDPSNIVNIIHLPVYLTDSSLKYFIKISYDTSVNLYSLLSIEERNYLQSPSAKNRYNYPTTSSSYTTFKIMTILNENSISIPKGQSNINYICLYINENSEDVILNEHLDLYSETQINIGSCDSFKYANSYMGCFDLYINCENTEGTDMILKVKYNNIDSSSEIKVNLYDINNIDFVLQSEQSSSNIEYTGDQTQTKANLIFTTQFSSLSVELFKTFINGEKIENVQILNPDGSTDALNFVLPIEYFYTNPKTKNIMILYDDGSNTQYLLMTEEYSITVKQKDYTNALFNDYYTFKVQDPLSLKVGENMFLYLLIYDKSNNCYFGNVESLSNLEIVLQKDSTSYSTKKIEPKEIQGYSQCESIYYVDFEQNAEVSGYFDVIIKDGTSEFPIPSKIYIYPKEIDSTQSKIVNNNGETIDQEPQEVQAGHNIYLTFSGVEGSSIDFYDLINDIDIALVDKDGNKLEKNENNYSYELKVKSDNSGIDISIKINNYGDYNLQILKNTAIISPNLKISVQPLECSMIGPEFNLLEIDNRNDYYYKEKITIEIKCKDIFGNNISQKGTEIFKAYAIRETDNEIFEFDEKANSFKDGKHYIEFSLEEVGNYILDVTLDGKKYGESLNLEIKDIDTSKYNCMDKNQVNNLNDCDTSDYRSLLKEILGDDNICYETTNKGTLYKCTSTDTDCVKHTNQCECEGTSWQGFCYPEGNNPIALVTDELTTCLSQIENGVSCEDGTCRYKKEECETNFECPIGYKSCANKCILIKETCTVNINCNTGEVVCWDLSCASDYNHCPTRITCPQNKVLCPDGSCQLSGHCVQPPNRNCEEGEHQCADFSCVLNSDECPKNEVCDPGLSLCEDKSCNQNCKTEVAKSNDDSDDGNNNGALIGGVVGGVVGCVAIAGAAFYFFYWRKRKIMPNDEMKDLNTAEQNLNMAKNKENIDIYDRKEERRRSIRNNDNHSDVEEINTGKGNPNIASTEVVRTMKNAKKAEPTNI